MTTRNPERWLTRREAHALIIESLGELGPTWDHFKFWSSKTWRETGKTPSDFPLAIKVRGSTGLIYDRIAIEKWLSNNTPEAISERQERAGK